MTETKNYQTVFDQIPGLLWKTGKEGVCEFVNQSWVEFTGSSKEQQTGEGWVDALHQEDRERVLKSCQCAHQEHQPVEIDYRVRHHSGEYRWIRDQGRPIFDEHGEYAGTVHTCFDLTEQKNIERSLRDREQMIISAVATAPVVFFRINKEGIIRLSIGKSLAQQLGRGDPIGKSIYDVFVNNPEIIKNFERALAGEAFTTTFESENLVYEITYSPVFTQAGEADGVVGVAFDITGHRQVEDALRKSVARFRRIFEDAELGIKLIDLEGRIVEANPAIQEMLGYRRDELIGMSFTEITHPRDLQMHSALLESLLAGKIDDFKIEKRYRRKDGSMLWGSLVMSLLRDDDGKPQYAIGMVEDITAQKVLQGELAEMHRRLLEGAEEERLFLAQELHDAPIQDLQGANFIAAALLQQVTEDSPQREQLVLLSKQVQQAIHSLRGITGELRPPTLAPFGLEKAIRSYTEQVCERDPGLEINLDLMSDGQIIPERVRLALFRIFQQLLNNTVQHAQATKVLIRFQFDEERISLKVEDNGMGFQTPKRWIELLRKKHYGLVGSIERAEAIGGKVEIHSHPGAGTHIQVMVPMHEELQIAPGENAVFVMEE